MNCAGRLFIASRTVWHPRWITHTRPALWFPQQRFISASVALPRMNTAIKSPNVQLIDFSGTNHGVVSTRHAIGLAKQDNLDLIEVAAGNGKSPPVCRILKGYSIIKQAKKKAAPPKSSKKIAFSCKIADHDKLTKMNKVEKLLGKGHPVNIQVGYRRPVRLDDNERTPSQIYNDEIVVEEAEAILHSIISEIKGGKVNEIKKAYREIKTSFNPLGRKDR